MKLVLLAMLLASPALAEGNQCANRQIVLRSLAEKYGETRQSIGLSSTGNAVEIFANLDTGTWTAIQTTPDGVTCLVAAGDAFELVLEPGGMPS